MTKGLQIKIPDPAWGSNLARIILDLEKLRSKKLIGGVPEHIFFQLKEIFQILETLGSARIEGNNTTLSEYVESIIDQKDQKDTGQQEVWNLEQAIRFIEDNTDEKTRITRAYISELHKITTKDLSPPPNGEGSRNPGGLRTHNVIIKKAKHSPPDVTVLLDYFEKFLEFINTDFQEQYQLLMVAITHHRFAYIHPFDNGNGRMGRLLNYALLIKLGFQVKHGRIINPSSVFYADRDKYYNMLAVADSLADLDILNWSEYFLLGLKNEIEKIDSLLSETYVRDKILLPAISFARERENITAKEFEVLKYILLKDEMLIKSTELTKFGFENPLQKSRFVTKLKEKKILRPVKEAGRIYTVNFVNNYLLRGVIESLRQEGFVSDFLNK